jgi:hypothetical protein
MLDRQLKLGFVYTALTAALALPSLAVSQVTSVTTSRTVTATPDYREPQGFPTGSVGDSAYEIGAGDTSLSVNNYQVSADVTPTDIVFADNATSQGFIASTSTSTSVVVNYANGGPGTVTPTLQSTITPGGFGFYVDNPAGNPTEVGEGVSDVNQTPQSNTATFDSINESSNPAAAVSFSFDIYSGADTTPVLSFSDSLSLTLGGPGGFTVTAGAAPALSGFQLITPAGNDQRVAYQWNATTVDVPLGVSLAPGQSSTLTYVTTVTTSTAAEIACATNPCPSLLAYAGFGDPISKSAGAKGISDPYFARLELGLPTFDPITGKLDETLLPTSLPSLALPYNSQTAPFEPVPTNVLGVPEPATWFLALVGTAAIGSALRARRGRRAV